MTKTRLWVNILGSLLGIVLIGRSFLLDVAVLNCANVGGVYAYLPKGIGWVCLKPNKG